ncbi:MAG: hypothetical protein Q4G43_10030 [Mobilicoccus sp.]|nr:hypothetical protein [Mobilicoccus sp.]
MSRKSRPPKADKKKKGKKGKKSETTIVEEVIVEEPGLPFGVVVLIALVMSLPSLMGFFDGALAFRPMMVRLLAALLVSWLLCYLVWSVFGLFHSPVDEEKTSTTETTYEGMRDPYGTADPSAYPDPYATGPDQERRAG